MTLDSVIRNLHENDARKDFWKRIKVHIENGQYGLVCELISSHSDDIDYSDQCQVIVQAIAKHSGRE